MDLSSLYQEVIIDHNNYPRNCGEMCDPSVKADGYNPLCGDELTLFIKKDNDVIADARFVGKGCAISTASASMMTDMLKGKTVAEARELFGLFHELLTKDEVSSHEALDKLNVLAGVKQFPSRVKCATLAWHTLIAALDNQETPASTE